MLELLICLAVLGILFNLSVPAMRNLVTTTSLDKQQFKFVAMLQLARQTAVNRNVVVSVCGSSDGMRCIGNWAQGSIAFEDLNADAVVSENESVLLALPSNGQVSAIIWRSFRNKSFLSFTPAGLTDNQSGSFTFCPVDADMRKARQVIINRTGRVRLARDENGDGLYEDSSGMPLRC